jgi:hypothetical protein
MGANQHFFDWGLNCIVGLGSVVGSWIKDFTNAGTEKDENGSNFGCLIREIVTPIRHPRRKKLGAFGSGWVHPSRYRKHQDQLVSPSDSQ